LIDWVLQIDAGRSQMMVVVVFGMRYSSEISPQRFAITQSENQMVKIAVCLNRALGPNLAEFFLTIKASIRQ